ncbi:hypothetical protein B0E50_01720 [Rhodanobacter sp. C01]|nr:hypothetical protein B0E50_01720 [Rhodanobacter sp. C01]
MGLLLLIFNQVPALANSVTYVYTDPQGTPLAEADANGNITATYDYMPYGSQALGTPPNGPGYTGHVNDPESGLVYMQARYYDPSVGRFISEDQEAPAAGNAFNFNRYDYANNNPILNVDPDGRAGKIAYLVELTATGMRKLAALSKEEAVIARRAGKNVVAPRRQLAHEIESAANDPTRIKRDPGHDLDDGSKGLPHYQSEDVTGHTFWGELSIISAATADDFEKLEKYAAYIPDPVPRPATADDEERWNNEKAWVSSLFTGKTISGKQTTAKQTEAPSSPGKVKDQQLPYDSW